MNILSKIIFTLISFSILILLIFVTYITNEYTDTKIPFYEKIKQGLFELKENDQGILSLDKISDTGSGELLVKYINSTDKIYFSTGNIQILEDKDTTNIEITPGIYYFDLKKINSKYVIKSLGFEIINNGPGVYIVNNLNPTKNIIFSLNSLIELNLKNTKTDEKITSLDLFPHSYLIFNPAKNIFVKNSDLLKISQNFTLGYFDKQIGNNDKISSDFLNLISFKNEKIENILKNIVKNYKQEYIDNIKIYENLLKSGLYTIPGENLILKYSNLFINPSKISAFNKNIILRNFNSLLTDENVSPQTINKIVNSINILRETDTDGLNEINEILNYYYNVTLSSNINLNIKLNITSLISRLNENTFNFELKSLVLLNKIFIKYDFLSNDGFYNEISSFRKNYFDDLNINLKGEKNNKYSIEDSERIDYLLFFMENILLTSDYTNSNIDTTDLIIIFSDYVNISSSFYIFNDEKVKRTGIYTNSKILNKFLNILEDKYFEKGKNENGLLVLKNIENNKKDNILLLEKNINELIKFFKEQKGTLSPELNTKDKIIISLYKNIEEKYKEYFAALKDYKEYIAKYDENKNILLETNSINENIKNDVLSINNVKDYLNKFNGMNINNSTIKIMDYNYCKFPSIENENLAIEIQYCYKIDNLIIDGKNISFLLHPYESNKMDEIILENSKKPGSYKLDEIKIDLDEKYKVASIDKENYNFYNFFINTFGQNNNITEIETQENIKNPIIVDDTVIKIFKRNKLLGESGDFSILNGFINITYNDLIVKKEKSGEYSIFIDSSKLNYSLSSFESFVGTISSKYDFSTKHSFINPEIILLNKTDESPLLYGNKINIDGEYNVKKIKDEIKKLFLNYKIINTTVSNIYNILNEKEITIKYNKTQDQVEFDTIYNGGKLYIKILNGYIFKLTYNNISLVKKIENISNLGTILNNIKK